MTMKVVTPARTSVPMFVPRSANLKYDAIPSTDSLPPHKRMRRTGRLGPHRHTRWATVDPAAHRRADRSWRSARLPPAVPAGRRPAPPLPDAPLLVLVGVEAEELHLDEAAGVELELARRERLTAGI